MSPLMLQRMKSFSSDIWFYVPLTPAISDKSWDFFSTGGEGALLQPYLVIKIFQSIIDLGTTDHELIETNNDGVIFHQLLRFLDPPKSKIARKFQRKQF